MWELDNQTGFAGDRTMVVDKNGERHLAVVIKGTFDIEPNGATKVADDQVEVKLLPEYRGEPGESSLVYEQDLIAAKPGTDIIVNAHAYAPNGKEARSVDVVLRVGTSSKTLRVHGTRVYTSGIGGLGTSKPIPFVKKPITYEWAYGGSELEDPDPAKQAMDPRNPVGKGFARSVSHLVNTAAHTVEYPRGNAAKMGPAGFGAIASYWSPRRELAGTYDAKWVEQRQPLLPHDFDPRWFMCAPADQQLTTYLRGGETFGLLNMTPTGVLSFALPKRVFRLTTFIGTTEHEHTAEVQTVVIEPEFPRVLVTWHSTLSCHHDIDNIDRVRVREKQFV
ncbi:MAG: DUF2169 domain-containing protein [Myxococcota bacterium]